MDRSESEESLDVPEEPKEDTTEDEFETKASKLGVPNDGKARRPSTALNFSTAVKIARWMARAYGYVAKKRKAYLVSDQSFSKSYFWDHNNSPRNKLSFRETSEFICERY